MPGFRFIYLLSLFFAVYIPVFSQGVIVGSILDHETQQPVDGAVVTIIELSLSAGTDADGKFEFRNIAYATYSLRVNSVGYITIVKTDVVVLSSRQSEVTIELIPVSYKTDTIDVVDKYFIRQPDVTSSNFNLDFEEVRRAPGAVEDISRMVQSLPGVSPGNDQRNDLIVRGGSPSENLILADGIELPNINHYPSQGSTGGSISMINVKLVQDMNFSTGGFSARYGDKLSSIMDIRLREGSRERFLSDINLSTAGFGGVIEGPLFGNNSSFLFSARKSYLNLIRGAIRLSAVPDYWDFNLKAVYDISKNNKLTFIGLGGIDKIKFEGEASEISDDNPYGNAVGDQWQYSAGITLKSLFRDGYILNTLSNINSSYYFNLKELRTNDVLFDYDSDEIEFGFKSELFYQMNRSNNIITGGIIKHAALKNNFYFRADTSDFGDPLPELRVNNNTDFFKAAAFAQYTLKLFKDVLILNAGIRLDHFSAITDKNVISPRFGASFKVTPVTTISFSGGTFFQSPEYLWLTTDPLNKELKYIKALQLIAGVEHLFTDELRVNVEAYYKKYNNYPVSYYIPTYILMNGGTENGPNFLGRAVSSGYGFTKGIDLSVHKKLTGNGIYGMINYSLLESRVTAEEGGEKPGSFDYRHNLTVIAGYQLSNDWLIGIKYRYTSGRPYTPFDVERSVIANRGVLDFSRFNEARYKDYSRLDIRVDKRWNFKKVSIVSYIEMQNVLNTENVYQYFWNKYKNELGTIYQWAFLPVGGVSVQF
jgi:hypothetical protein